MHSPFSVTSVVIHDFDCLQINNTVVNPHNPADLDKFHLIIEDKITSTTPNRGKSLVLKNKGKESLEVEKYWGQNNSKVIITLMPS